MKNDTVELQYSPTEIMEADSLRKIVNKSKVEQHYRNLMEASLTFGKANSISGGF